jgi:hypothetical protein
MAVDDGLDSPTTVAEDSTVAADEDVQDDEDDSVADIAALVGDTKAMGSLRAAVFRRRSSIPSGPETRTCKALATMLASKTRPRGWRI